MGSDKLFQKKKFRKTQELVRQKAKQHPYETIHIICEGTTEFEYFNNLAKFFRLNTANVTVVTAKGSAPISIVEHGIHVARETPNIDRIVSVFDRDDHESYERAIKKIETNKPKHSDKANQLIKQ